MLDFPASPALNQQFSAGNSSWVWDGTAWNIVPQMVPAVASDTPPANPAVGQFWWRSSNGQLYVYYLDPSGPPGQWVQAVAPAQAPLAPARAWELIGDYTLSAVASLSVPNLAPFRKLRITGAIFPSVSSGLQIRVSNNNGSSFDGGATSYTYQQWTASGTVGSASTGSGTGISISAGVSGDVGTMVALTALVENFNVTGGMRVISHGTGQMAAALIIGYIGGSYAVLPSRNAIQILPGAGGTMTGTVTVEGVRG